jgi:hypothetical protein
LGTGQPNITSVGTLTSLGVLGNITSGNANLGNVARANYFIGNGASLSSINGANVTGIAANANYAAFAGNVIGALTINNTGAGAGSGATFNGNSPVMISYNTVGAPKADGTSASGTWSINITGNANVANTANNIVGANVSGQVANALVTGTVYTNSQPNITSVGTLVSLGVLGNINSGNVISSFFGSAAGLTNLPAANIVGTVSVSRGGTGGNTVVAAGQSLGIIGVGQSWQNVSGSRALNVSYQNTTGRPINVSISIVDPILDQEDLFQVSTDNTNWITLSSLERSVISIIIPAGSYYRVLSDGITIAYWNELR